MNASQQRGAAPAAEAAAAAGGPATGSFDDWAQVIRGAGGPLAGPPARLPAEAQPYRPTIRGPMAVLQIVDDGSEDGQFVRIRHERVVIGRAEGEILIPHDISMSLRHAAIERHGDGGWSLSDLGSAGGTFVRVTTARLRDGSMIQVGRTRLRFQAVDLTEAWLTEERPDRAGSRHECHAPNTSLGRAGCGCAIGVDDPFISPVHAVLHRTPRGWTIENSGMNGLWVRIDAPVRMTAPSQFLCGEQRFVFLPCGGPTVRG